MAAALENGLIRLEIRDPQDRPVRTLFEERTEQLSRSATFSEQVPMAATNRGVPRPIIGEDWSLVLLMKSDESDNVVKANSKIFLSVTKYDVRQGKVQLNSAFQTTLTEADLIDAGTVAVVAGIWVEIGRYTVQAGEGMQIGQGTNESLESATGRFYCALYDDGE